MAKSYFGKYESQLDAQMALDQGKLLAPFVAMWDDTVHYNDLEETPVGEVGTEEYTQVPATGMTDTNYVTAGSLYWTVDDVPEWVSISSDSGYSDGSFDVTFDQNDVEEVRNGSFIVRFYYDDNHEHLRNEVTVTIEQEAAEAPSTGATVTLQQDTIGSWDGWYYLTVSGASDPYLYWTINPPDWVNNGESVEMEGDNSWWFQVGANPLQEREGIINVDFYNDSERTEWLYNVEVTLTQEGDGGYAPSFNSETYIGKQTVASGSGSTEVYILDNPGYAWEIQVDNFYDSAASSSTAVTIDYEETTEHDTADKTVTVNFYEDDTLQILVDTKTLTLTQEGNPDMLYAWWQDGGNFPSAGGNDTFFVGFNNPDVTEYAFSLTNGGGHFNSAAGQTAFTASTSSIATTGVTFFAEANTGSTFYGDVYIEAYDGSGQTLGNYSLSFSIEEPQPEVIAVCTFVTTSDNETQNVPSYDGGNWMNAYIDGDPSNVLQMNTTQYEFGTAGTHTITYVRETSDLELQGWFKNNDMVSVEFSCPKPSEWQPQGGWGFHGNENGYTFSGCTRLTGVTLDEYCVLLGKSGGTGNTTFIGCTSLVSITCNGSTAPVNDAGAFDTITGNTGTLHIPSGATSEYASLATDLGNNWTVVDDL